MTTDTVKKEIAVAVTIGGKKVTVGGMCKGAGMIHPNMCTMLSFVTTDACISQEMLQKALSAVVKDSYNMISVDGDTSTNDTALVLANAMAGNEEIVCEGEAYRKFYEALEYVSIYLARQIGGRRGRSHGAVRGQGGRRADKGAGSDAEQIDHHFEPDESGDFWSRRKLGQNFMRDGIFRSGIRPGEGGPVL